MQVTGMKDKVDFKYKNSFDAIRTIVRSEGLRGLYTGLSECTLFWTFLDENGNLN